MREVISVHLGQAGMRLGAEFWSTLAAEHSLPSDFLMNDTVKLPEAFFASSAAGAIVPRSLFIDNDEVAISSARRTFSHGRFSLHKESVIRDGPVPGIALSYALCHEKIVEQVRPVIEAADFAQNVVITHAVDAHFGPSYARQLRNALSEQFDSLEITQVPIFASQGVGSVLNPYNELFVMANIIHNSVGSVVLHNDGGLKVARSLSSDSSDVFMDHVNQVYASSLSGLFSSLRYPHPSSSIIFRDAFRLCSCAGNDPFLLPTARVPSVKAAFAHSNHLGFQISGAHADPEMNAEALQRIESEWSSLRRRGVITASNIPLSKLRADIAAESDERGNTSSFLPAIAAGPGSDLAVTGLFSSRASQRYAARVIDTAEKLFKRRAFVHWHVGAGMEEGEFGEALNELGEWLPHDSEALSHTDDF